jgi:hypothetical protein
MGGDLFRLQMVDDDSELALVALDAGNNHRRLLRHGAQRQDLFFYGWWLHGRGGHGNENRGGMGGNLGGSNDDGGWLRIPRQYEWAIREWLAGSKLLALRLGKS